MNNQNIDEGYKMTSQKKRYNLTIQLGRLKFRDTHSLTRLLSKERFGLSERQIQRLGQYNFTQFDENSFIVKKYPHLKNKLWEGNRYFKNEHLNMILCVSITGYLNTVIKLKGTDYSDYNDRKGWGSNNHSYQLN